MINKLAAAIAALCVAACTAQVAPPAPVAQQGPVEVQILAFNDLHGNLQVPDPVEVAEPDGTKHKITTGGVAHLAALLTDLRAIWAEQHPGTPIQLQLPIHAGGER